MGSIANKGEPLILVRMARLPPKEVREIVGDPRVMNLVEEARQRMMREAQNVVLPRLCSDMSLLFPPAKWKFISSAVKILLRDNFRKECRNADLTIPSLFKNNKYRWSKKEVFDITEWPIVDHRMGGTGSTTTTPSEALDILITTNGGGLVVLQCRGPSSEEDTSIESRIFPLRLDRRPNCGWPQRRKRGWRQGRSK